jgi:hypothetical protein
MLRTATQNDLSTNLDQLFAELQRSNESILVREDGIAVGAVLTGEDYQRYRTWLSEHAWNAIDNLREEFADVPQEEIERIVDEAVREVRQERHAARKSS